MEFFWAFQIAALKKNANPENVIMVVNMKNLYQYLNFKLNEVIYSRNFPEDIRTNILKSTDFQIENAESLHISTPDNESLHTYLLPPSDTAPQKNVIVLMFHGNAGNISHRLSIGKVLSESLNCHVFMLEYRGYGLLIGTLDENRLAIDAQTALNYIQERAE